jgi:polysaccharide export outer membrane protein
MNSGSPSGDQKAMRHAFVILIALMCACGDNPPVSYPAVAPLDVTKLKLGPGDKLQLTIFYGTKEMKTDYALDGSGQMEVQFIGMVKAGGKHVREVQEDIQKRLADGYLVEPVVQLTIVEMNSLTCSVLGQVMRNGTVKYTPGMTIVDAIAQSGGFSPLARKNLVRVTRTTDDSKKLHYEIPVEMIGEGKRPNFQLMPGDEVFVPERSW